MQTRSWHSRSRGRLVHSLGILLTAGIWSPQPPAAKDNLCSYADIHPAYPPLNATPAAEASAVSNSAPPPSGANCFEEEKDAASWITVASVLQTSMSPSDIIKRFGAISELRDIQYWSTTDQAWRPMIATAFAVGSVDADQPRGDYSPAELAEAVQYYRVADTRTQAPINYRLEIHLSPHNQVVAETANVNPVKKWGITLYAPGGVHTLYFLNERAPGIWSYYSITRVIPATFLARGNEKSSINRAIALYRHYMTLPTAAEPPAVR